MSQSNETALGPEALVRAFSFAADWLGVHVDEVNALNVYPVPDGDTGTNMHLTLQSARRQFEADNPQDMAGFAHALSYGSLLGARGNSGVILSQVLKGFSESIRQHEKLGSEELTGALREATGTAYRAVMKPVEGTILTVVRRVADAAEQALATARRPAELLSAAIAGGHEALKETPEMLPILKQAGVVDAGGLGFLRILEGLLAHLQGRELPPAPEITSRAQLQFGGEEVHGFCTEFLLADATQDATAIREMVSPYGDSLLVVGAEGFIKGHIHTEEPEAVLAMVARHGRMVQTKVEDMSEQHSEILAGMDVSEAVPDVSGVIAVSDGYGITGAFRALGARIVGGGQTRNPSVQDMVDAIRSVAAHEIVILPNNKNIVLAAERVPALVKDKLVRVLPSLTFGQGLAALTEFDSSRPLEDIWDSMAEAAANTVTLEVTRATRDVVLDGVEVTEDDHIGLIDGNLVTAAGDPAEALLTMVHEAAEGKELATLFYSATLGRETCEEVQARIEAAWPELEVELHAGSPEMYSFVMMLE